ncbi:hypothetical protein PPTG_11661 [Phytophthora nicotianae INRA-310]|uniref:Uncharacterized protein n=1 Tax=Phytophthora nicotianae (strain INRA-310) TaxID=761204 RepID=W2Q6N8_PHYN3|nr:hypothetical protein PPTG_11661 [Phytophthora nicotianae INRA-310]ETN08848.1 hypothetical protein PPTG_11661 [Phytophthora nicotianae INRA-310]
MQQHYGVPPHAETVPLRPQVSNARLAGVTVATKSSAKKPRSTKKLTASTLLSYDYTKLLEVNPNAPQDVRTVIAIVLHKDEEAGKIPWHLAYPWSGRPLRYDPGENRDIHRAHGRFWMTHRRAFWKWAFHVPLETTPAQSNRRKLKMRATLARLSFTSVCIETWGFYAFLEKLEKRPEMFWLGGQPGKSSRGADTNGYSQVLSFVEFTKALNPEAIAKNRLSMTALARIRQDLTSGTKLKTS